VNLTVDGRPSKYSPSKIMLRSTSSLRSKAKYDVSLVIAGAKNKSAACCSKAMSLVGNDWVGMADRDEANLSHKPEGEFLKLCVG
jgi:hypothetical protein